MRRTALYRFFAADDTLLYVGIAYDVEARTRSHRRTAVWFDQQTRRTVQWFDRRLDALRAEVEAICAECPRHNKRHAGRAAPPAHDDEASDSPEVQAALAEYVGEVIALLACVRKGFFRPSELIQLKNEAMERLGLCPYMSPVTDLDDLDVEAYEIAIAAGYWDNVIKERMNDLPYRH